MPDDEPYAGGLTVTAHDEPGALVLVVVGELDADTSGTLREAVDGAAVDGAVLVADMSGVTFIDSSGLSALVHAAAVTGDRGGKFSIRAASASVSRLLELTGQSDRFL